MVASTLSCIFSRFSINSRNSSLSLCATRIFIQRGRRGLIKKALTLIVTAYKHPSDRCASEQIPGEKEGGRGGGGGTG